MLSPDSLWLLLDSRTRTRTRTHWTRTRTRTLVQWTRTRTRTLVKWTRTHTWWTRTLVLWTRTRTRTLALWTRTHCRTHESGLTPTLSKTDPFGRHIPVYRFYGSTPRGYEFLGSSCTPRQTQMRVCHPTLFQKLRAFDLCLFAKWLPPPATDKI